MAAAALPPHRWHPDWVAAVLRGEFADSDPGDPDHPDSVSAFWNDPRSLLGMGRRIELQFGWSRAAAAVGATTAFSSQRCNRSGSF